MNLPSQSITEACYATTLFTYIYIYIYRREMNPPWSIDHRGFAYHYTAYI